MSNKRESYPLQWPEGWKRTIGRGKPLFAEQGFARMRDSVIRQLRKRGSNVVITSDLPLRQDGLPYANANCPDPGIAVWWVEKGKEMVIACDRWRTINFNITAIDRTLEALRGIDRWGASTLVDKAFSGFAALPPPGGTDFVQTPAMPPWHVVFEIPDAYRESMSKSELLGFVKMRYRDRIKRVHPDLGGNDINQAVILNAALEAAEKELANG